MSDTEEDSDVESKTMRNQADVEIETEAVQEDNTETSTSNSPRRTTRRTRQRTQLYRPPESPPKKRKRKIKAEDEEKVKVMKKHKEKYKEEASEADDSDKGGNDSDGDDDEDEDSIPSPPVKRKRSSLAKNLTEADLTCPHCQKLFTVKPGLDYHVDNFVCRPTLRPGGPVVKGKRKKAASSTGGTSSSTKNQSYKRIRGKLEDRTCPKCKRVFTSVLGFSYHREKLVCELAKNKTEGSHCLLDTLEPGSQFVTPYGIVEVVTDERAVPTATEIPKKMADLCKSWNSSHTKQQIQIRKLYSAVAVKSLLRRSHLHDYYNQNLTTRNTVWKAYFGEDPRSIPADLHSQPVKMPVPTKSDPLNPADCFPDRIVECVLIPDERNRFWGLSEELGKANASQGITGTRLFLRRRLLTDPYIVNGDVFLCKNCGRSFTSKPGCKYHMTSEVCIVKAKKAAEIASQMRAEVQVRCERERKKPPPKLKPRHPPRSNRRPKDLAVYPSIWLTLGFHLVALGPIARHMSAFEKRKALSRAKKKPTDEVVEIVGEQEQSTTEAPRPADKVVMQKSISDFFQKTTTGVPKQADKIVREIKKRSITDVSAGDGESPPEQVDESPDTVEIDFESGDNDFQNPDHLLNDLKAKLAVFTPSGKKRSRKEVQKKAAIEPSPEEDDESPFIETAKSTSSSKKKSRKKAKKKSATEVDAKSTPAKVPKKSATEVTKSATKRVYERPGTEIDVDKSSRGYDNPGTILTGLKASLAKETLGAMYPSVLISLGYRLIPEPPKKRRVIKRRNRKKKEKEPPPKRPLPPVVDVRVLVKEVESGRYPSMGRLVGDVEHDDLCYICKKEGNLVCCDFCSKAVHFDCMRTRFTLPYPEPRDDFMCNHCIQAIMARRNRAEKRRLEKAGVDVTLTTVPDDATAATRLTRELVEGMEYDCVAAQGREVNDLVKLVRDSQIRLQRHSEMVKMNKIRRSLMQS